jgi:predicted Zn-dependent protease
MPQMPRRPPSVSYEYIRERLRVLTATTGNDLRRHYERERAAQPDNGALRYGAALVEMQSGNAGGAIALLQPLVAEQPQLPLLHIALAQAQVAAGQQQEGIASFEHGLMLSPRNVPLTVRYAEALLGMDQAKKSHQLLLDLFNNVPPTAEQIRLIARAASDAGDAGDAYAYMAELNLANGDLPMAITQLDSALAAPGLTEVQRKRFRARRQEIRDAVRESSQRGRREQKEDSRDSTRDNPRDTSRDGPRSPRS